jgi:hypothetical protein
MASARVSAGLAIVTLLVCSSARPGATRPDERVGMTAHPRFVTWEKEVRQVMSAALGLSGDLVRATERNKNLAMVPQVRPCLVELSAASG